MVLSQNINSYYFLNNFTVLTPLSDAAVCPSHSLPLCNFTPLLYTDPVLPPQLCHQYFGM